MLQNDPDYCRWILATPGLKQKYGETYNSIETLIINNFGQPSDSPEHNAFQARFVDKSYSYSVLNFACNIDNRLSRLSFTADRWLKSRTIDYCELAVESASKLTSLTKRSEHYRARYEKDLFKDIPRIDLINRDFKVIFEHKGWDVVVCADLKLWIDPFGPELRLSERLPIELKPSVGDDFPYILRQVKNRSEIGIVIADEFCATTVSIDDAKSMFMSSGSKLIISSEIPKIGLPEIFSKERK